MFSKKDIRIFSLIFDFTGEKRKETVAEWIFKNVPLSMLKLEETEILTVSTRIFEGLPLISASDSERGISLSISKNSIRLTLAVERPPFVVKEEKENVATELFDDEVLNKLSNDLNFLIGKVSGLLDNKGINMKSSGQIRLRKRETSFDISHNFSDNLARALGDYGEVTFKGLTFELEGQTKLKELECENSEEGFVLNASFNVSCKQPIILSTLIKEILEEINSICTKIVKG